MQMLRDDFDIDVRVLGITNSSRMLLCDAAIDLGSWQESFDKYGPPANNNLRCANAICFFDDAAKHRVKKNMRRPGVEPGSFAWKANILTVEQPALLAESDILLFKSRVSGATSLHLYASAYISQICPFTIIVCIKITLASA